MSESQWIWVTGASTGIGQALARRLLRGGHRVVVSARSEDKLEALAHEFPEQCRPLTDRNDFDMPFLIEAEAAAEHIARGMAKRQRIVQFPWQLVWTMRLISWLPLGWKTALLKKMVKD